MTKPNLSEVNGPDGQTMEMKTKDEDEVDEAEKEETKVDVKVRQSGPPIDRGYAWIVLAGCVLETFIYGGLNKSFGVFFLQYQMRFNSNASETALMSLVQNVVISITALLVMTIGLKKFSTRVAVFIGGTLTVAAYLITAFTSDIRVFYFAQGGLGGAGMALIVPPILATIGLYFEKHRGLANGILMGGSSVGGLIFAPVTVKLFDEFQYTGAFLIISALLMNIWVSALLLRPIDSYTKKQTKSAENPEQPEEQSPLVQSACNKDPNKVDKLTFEEINEETVVIKSEHEEKEHFLEHPALKSTEFTRMQSYDPSILDRKYQASPLLQRMRTNSQRLRQRTISENSQRYKSENDVHHSKHALKGVIDAISHSQINVYASGEGICGSFISLNVPSVQEISKIDGVEAKSDSDEINEKNDDSSKCCTLVLNVLRTIFDVGLLKDPVFITFMFMSFSLISGVALIPVYMPTHSKDIGISNEKIGLLISLMAVIDLVSKLILGVAADRKWFRRSTMMLVLSFILGTTIHLMRFVNSFETMVIFVVIAGICCGQYMSVFSVILIEVIGPEKFKSCLGFVTVVHGTSIAVFFPIAGLLRDVTGSYVASFHLLGGLAYVGGVLAFLIPVVNKWMNGKKEKNITEDPANKT